MLAASTNLEDKGSENYQPDQCTEHLHSTGLSYSHLCSMRKYLQ